jgi:tetratricopeptide (TPR) repeat protein
MSKKFGKLNFKIQAYEDSIEGEFDWGLNREEIFERFYDAEELDDPDLAFREYYQIIDDDPEFIDAYSSLGWWEIRMSNYGHAFVHFITAYEIGSKLIPKDFQGTIIWGIIGNRPFLRTMHGLGLAYESMRQYEKADLIYEQILAYNPNDNQGVRALAIENKLFMGDYKGILKICELFEEDAMPDVLYGKVVALYRLGRKDKAKYSLKEAIEYCPNVAKELLKKKHSEIQNDVPGTLTFGGEDEAYDYWQRTRVIWTDAELVNFVKNGI